MWSLSFKSAYFFFFDRSKTCLFISNVGCSCSLIFFSPLFSPRKLSELRNHQPNLIPFFFPSTSNESGLFLVSTLHVFFFNAQTANVGGITSQIPTDLPSFFSSYFTTKRNRSPKQKWICNQLSFLFIAFLSLLSLKNVWIHVGCCFVFGNLQPNHHFPSCYNNVDSIPNSNRPKLQERIQTYPQLPHVIFSTFSFLSKIKPSLIFLLM